MTVYCYSLEYPYADGLFLVAAENREMADLRAKDTLPHHPHFEGTLEELRERTENIDGHTLGWWHEG